MTSEESYHEIVLFAFSRLGFNNLADIEKMTLYEYEIRTEAYLIQKAERQGEMALQSWFNQQVKMQKGSAKNPQPYYRELPEMYDVQAQVESIRAEYETGYTARHMSKQDKAARQAKVFAQRMEEFEELKKAGKIIPLSERN